MGKSKTSPSDVDYIAARTAEVKIEEATARKYKRVRGKKARIFLQKLDQTLCQGRVHKRYRSHGGLYINWRRIGDKRTAGRACLRTGLLQLSGPLLNTEQQTLDTLAHEFCHFAAECFGNRDNDDHGPTWKAWGAKCTYAFPQLTAPMAVYHNYYTHELMCEKCGKIGYEGVIPLDGQRYCVGNGQISCGGNLVQTKPLKLSKKKRKRAD
ncbi:SprT-like family-domain-containing protein [Geopyxis carbonaria]|nr:SprT-like family-domain-containing protein [Geopyxis carbonaria]